MTHPIFSTPNQVNLTLEDLPTPADYHGEIDAKTMPMWRVQTEGYTERNHQLVGIVSSNLGFSDSPDTEWISSGVNSKNAQAVAIGRHGNFLMWGFAASPTFLTDEAKLTFVNAVHYIAKFDHKAPIARKRKGTRMRASVRAAIESMGDVEYQRTLDRFAKSQEQEAKWIAEIQAQLDAGEEIDEGQRMLLNEPKRSPPGRFDRVKRLFSDEKWATVQGDATAIRSALEADLPYMRSVGWYELEVDEDLRNIGIPNDSLTLIESAISALGGQQDDIAQRVLARYTEVSMPTKQDWEHWLQANHKRLFFSESGGYKWLVDTTAAPQETTMRPSASPRAASSPADAAQVPAVTAVSPKPALKPSRARPLVAAATLTSTATDRHTLTIHTQVLDGWHAYNRVPPGSPYTAMAISLQLPNGLKATPIERPSGHLDATAPGLVILEGDFDFTCELHGELPSKLDTLIASIRYQVCDEQMCRPPTTVALPVTRADG